MWKGSTMIGDFWVSSSLKEEAYHTKVTSLCGLIQRCGVKIALGVNIQPFSEQVINNAEISQSYCHMQQGIPISCAGHQICCSIALTTWNQVAILSLNH